MLCVDSVRPSLEASSTKEPTCKTFGAMDIFATRENCRCSYDFSMVPNKGCGKIDENGDFPLEDVPEPSGCRCVARMECPLWSFPAMPLGCRCGGDNYVANGHCKAPGLHVVGSKGEPRAADAKGRKTLPSKRS